MDENIASNYGFMFLYFTCALSFYVIAFHFTAAMMIYISTNDKYVEKEEMECKKYIGHWPM